MRHRPLSEIANDVRSDWKPLDRDAEPYLTAMERLDPVTDRFRSESAIEILAKFRLAARGWEGPTAEKIKEEIDQILSSAFRLR
jgi:hypothetical protein